MGSNSSQSNSSSQGSSKSSKKSFCHVKIVSDKTIEKRLKDNTDIPFNNKEMITTKYLPPKLHRENLLETINPTIKRACPMLSGNF